MGGRNWALLTTLIGSFLVHGIASGAAATITILYQPILPFTAIFIAADQGYFAGHNLDVDLSLAANSATSATVLPADSAQIATLTPTQILQANEQGLDLVFVAGSSLFPNPGGNGILARHDAGIGEPRDLVGKKLATPAFGGTAEVIAKKWLQSKGVDYRTVNWAELPFLQMEANLKAGRVDAVATVDPFYSRIIGDHVAIDIGNYASIVPAGTITTGYASTRSWAASHKEVLSAFRASLDDAIAYFRDQTHRDAVRASIAKYTKVPLPIVAGLPWPTNLNTGIPKEGMKFWIDASREQGLIKGNPDPATLVVP